MQYMLDRIRRPLDPWLVWPVLLLFGISLLLLYSATHHDATKVFDKAKYAVLAFCVMWGIAAVPPTVIIRFAPFAYATSIIFLLLVFLFGVKSHGATRWLNLGVLRVQPSELMQVVVPVMLAWYFHRYQDRRGAVHFLVALGFVLLPVALILKQPDLGTAVLVAAAGFYFLFFAGLSWRVIGGGVLVLAALIYSTMHWELCIALLHQYQCRRIATMLDPLQDPLGAGYHTLQGMIAIGSGGGLGKGWLHGTQTHLDFIPERTTDFIFAVYGEEFGLLGSVVLFCLYLLIILRGLYIANRASTLFGRLLAGAISMTFFTYVFINVGMVLGLLPVVGVPLPLVSYGGSSMVSILVGFGLLINIGRDRKLIRT